MDDLELELLLIPAHMSDAEKEFRAWIKSCKGILATRNPLEVAELAILCGFDRETVYTTLSTFQDAMDGTHVDNRARFQLFNFTMAVERVQKMKEDMTRIKELDLSPLWRDLHAYQTGEVA